MPKTLSDSLSKNMSNNMSNIISNNMSKSMSNNMSTSLPYTMPQHMSKRVSKKCRNFRHQPSHPGQSFTMAIFSTLMCRKTQTLMAFFRHNTVENLSKNLSKTTSVFGSVCIGKLPSVSTTSKSFKKSTNILCS
jgi:hypothetical protein